MDERRERGRRALHRAEEKGRVEGVDDGAEEECAERGPARDLQHSAPRERRQQEGCGEVPPREHTGHGSAVGVGDLHQHRRDGEGDSGGKAEERAADVWEAEPGHGLKCTGGRTKSLP